MTIVLSSIRCGHGAPSQLKRVHSKKKKIIKRRTPTVSAHLCQQPTFIQTMMLLTCDSWRQMAMEMKAETKNEKQLRDKTYTSLLQKKNLNSLRGDKVIQPGRKSANSSCSKPWLRRNIQGYRRGRCLTLLPSWLVRCLVFQICCTAGKAMQSARLVWLEAREQ